MLFSSIVFLYFFLPAVIFLYYFVPSGGRNFILLLMSILFYAWGEPVYVLLMLAQIAAAFLLTGGMERFRDSGAGRVFYILSVLLPFAALFYFKYYGFFAENIFGIRAEALPLPIGISFYTFQIVSYCIDVYRQRVDRQKDFITFAAYVTLFPQLVAGPIVRYSEIERTLTNGTDFSNMHVNFEKGAVRFAVGLGKKVLIANVLGEFVAEVPELGQRTFALSWAYAIAVAMQIYFDFSGYSDMAIGLGSIFGFRFPENFRYPFISKSVSEFWRRWHITLGAWFRDYVYIPMGGSRVGMIQWIFNILVVWLFTGLWHGAGWNFIVWGLMFAALLALEKCLGSFFRGFCGSVEASEGSGKVNCADGKKNGVQAGIRNTVIRDAVKCVLRHSYVVVVILVSFLIFHNGSLDAAWADIQSLFCRGPRILETPDEAVCDYLLGNRAGILCIGLIGSTPFPLWLWHQVQAGLRKHGYGDVAVHILRGVLTVGLLVLCTAYLIDGSFNPFLYFRF